MLQLELQILNNLEQIQLFIPCDPNVTIQPNIFFLQDCKIGDAHTSIFKITNEGILPLRLTIMISFVNKQSVARIVKRIVDFSPDVFIEKRPPQKDAHFKATLSLSQSVEFLGIFTGLSGKSF